MKKSDKATGMKLLVWAVCIVTALSLSACSSAIFRTVSFGMTRDDVKEAEQAFGDPQVLFADDSLLYEGQVYAGIGGDLIYSFGADGLLNRILFYPYRDNYTDEACIAIMTELSEAYEGSPFDAENPTVTNAFVWTDENQNVTVSLLYNEGVYLTVTLEPADLTNSQ